MKMTLTDEDKEKYEKEFSEFLLQNIKKLGGSLQFQHLTSLLPQLSFDVKNAVGSSKVQLMRFLKSHPKIFKVDSKGLVSAVESSAVENDHRSSDSSMTKIKSSLPPDIQNGKGYISKLHSEFGFIRATQPIKTTVYFRALQWSGDNDDLLAEYDDLKVNLRVCFNALIGHDDCDAKYRATKVWKDLKHLSYEDAEESDLKHGNYDGFEGSNSSRKSEEQKESGEKNLNGEGIILKVSEQFGFISVDGRKKDSVFFRREDLEDFDIDDLTKVLKCGDGVEFAAKRSMKSKSQAKWQAIAVWKKSKKSKQRNKESDRSSDKDEVEIKSPKSRSGNADSLSVLDDNYKELEKKMLKDQHGKISILPDGNIKILFGKNFMKISNGDSSTAFFLYGAKVTDIPWEFSDGDDVRFDAVKIKAEPGWKAVLVWVGEKPDYVLPTCLGDFSEIADEELDKMPEEKSYSRSISCSSFEKSVRSNTHSFKTEQLGKKENTDHCDSKQKFENKCDRDYNRKNLKLPKSGSQSIISIRESNKHRQRKEPPIKYTSFSKCKGKQNSTPTRRVSPCEDHQKKYLSKNYTNRQNMTVSENSDNGIEDDELQTVSEFLNSPHKNDHFYKKSVNQRKSKSFNSLLDSEADNSEHDGEVLETKKIYYGRSSVKEFRNINGTVTKVNCKFAFVQNPDLQDTVNFVSNAFYKNGLSVEEQQVDDLREIISSDVTVKLNCFEIIDDFGKIHHKVTLAWLGDKPNISEITPEEFIKENNLSVTIKDASDNEDAVPAKNAPKKFLSAATNSDSEDEKEDSSMKFSSSENASDDETSLSSKCSKQSETNKHKVFLKRAESSVNYKLLSEILSQQLESKGLLHQNSEVNLNELSAEIVDVIVQRHQGANKSDNQLHTVNQHLTGDNHVGESVCSHCAKTLSGAFPKHNSNLSSKESQTIITGEIVAQNTFFTGKKKLQVTQK